jgi:multidrug efflux system membrane fusion protein
LSYTKIVAPLSGRAGLRQVDQGNIVHASDATGVVVITQLQPIGVWFSLPQQQIVRVNTASGIGTLAVDVFANDGSTVADTGTLTAVDNQVDQTTGTVKLKAEFPNASFQLWPGQFVNVRLKVQTINQAIVVPTASVQRGPAGTFVYVVGSDDIATARVVTVTQQNEKDAVIAKGIGVIDRVVTSGFANLADGAKVAISKNYQEPTLDLAPRKRDGGQKGEKGERRGQKAQDGAAPGAPQSGGATKAPQ